MDDESEVPQYRPPRSPPQWLLRQNHNATIDEYGNDGSSNHQKKATAWFMQRELSYADILGTACRIKFFASNEPHSPPPSTSPIKQPSPLNWPKVTSNWKSEAPIIPLWFGCNSRKRFLKWDTFYGMAVSNDTIVRSGRVRCHFIAVMYKSKPSIGFRFIPTGFGGTMEVSVCFSSDGNTIYCMQNEYIAQITNFSPYDQNPTVKHLKHHNVIALTTTPCGILITAHHPGYDEEEESLYYLRVGTNVSLFCGVISDIQVLQEDPRFLLVACSDYDPYGDSATATATTTDALDDLDENLPDRHSSIVVLDISEILKLQQQQPRCNVAASDCDSADESSSSPETSTTTTTTTCTRPKFVCEYIFPEDGIDEVGDTISPVTLKCVYCSQLQKHIIGCSVMNPIMTDSIYLFELSTNALAFPVLTIIEIFDHTATSMFTFSNDGCLVAYQISTADYDINDDDLPSSINQNDKHTIQIYDIVGCTIIDTPTTTPSTSNPHKQRYKNVVSFEIVVQQQAMDQQLSNDRTGNSNNNDVSKYMLMAGRLDGAIEMKPIRRRWERPLLEFMKRPCDDDESDETYSDDDDDISSNIVIKTCRRPSMKKKSKIVVQQQHQRPSPRPGQRQQRNPMVADKEKVEEASAVPHVVVPYPSLLLLNGPVEDEHHPKMKRTSLQLRCSYIISTLKMKQSLAATGTIHGLLLSSSSSSMMNVVRREDYVLKNAYYSFNQKKQEGDASSWKHYNIKKKRLKHHLLNLKLSSLDDGYNSYHYDRDRQDDVETFTTTVVGRRRKKLAQ